MVGVEGVRPPKAAAAYAALDSARLLSDGDLVEALASPAWQTCPGGGKWGSPEDEVGELDAELTRRARAAESGCDAYCVALQALWHNCPEALETALGTVRAETELMAQKLEFTRIRQRFVALCRRFRSHASARDAGGGAVAPLSEADFLAGVEELRRCCDRLFKAQDAEQACGLPGLVTSRDTVLLASRISEVSARLVATSRREAERQQQLQAAQRRHRSASAATRGSALVRSTSSGASANSGAGQRGSAVAAAAVRLHRMVAEEAALLMRDACTGKSKGRGLPRQAMYRLQLIAALFFHLDADGDGVLAMAELRSFGTGCLRLAAEEDVDEWAAQYEQLCKTLGCQPHAGLNFHAFVELVDDAMECGSHRTNGELAAWLESQDGGSSSNATLLLRRPTSGGSMVVLPPRPPQQPPTLQPQPRCGEGGAARGGERSGGSCLRAGVSGIDGSGGDPEPRAAASPAARLRRCRSHCSSTTTTRSSGSCSSSASSTVLRA